MTPGPTPIPGATVGGPDLETGSFSGARYRGGVFYLLIATFYRAGNTCALARDSMVRRLRGSIARYRAVTREHLSRDKTRRLAGLSRLSRDRASPEASGSFGAFALGRPVAQSGGSRKFAKKVSKIAHMGEALRFNPLDT